MNEDQDCLRMMADRIKQKQIHSKKEMLKHNTGKKNKGTVGDDDDDVLMNDKEREREVQE